MDGRTFFKMIPDPLQYDIARHFPTRSIINLSLVDKFTYKLFQPTLFQRLQYYVERGAKKQVGLLLTIHPELISFSCTKTSIPYADNNYSEPTVLQLARALCDIDMCMVLVTGRKEALFQIQHFPKILIVKENTYDFTVLITAIETGIQLEETLVTFRNDLDKIIREKGFPFQALVDACEIYDKKVGQWQQLDVSKIFAVKVIGYFQRKAPFWFRRALACGISNCGESNFILSCKQSVDPANDIPGFGLGYEFCINAYGNSDQTPLGLWSEQVLTQGIAIIIKGFFLQRQHILDLLCDEICSMQLKITYPKKS